MNIRSLGGTNSVIVTRIRNGEPLSLVGTWRSIDGWWGRPLLGTKAISAGLKETMFVLLIFRSKGIGIDFCPGLVSAQLKSLYIAFKHHQGDS